MIRGCLVFSLVALSICHGAILKADEAPSTENPSCGKSLSTQRVSLRHIENKGVGYNTGYTTLEGFFVPSSDVASSSIPFLDVRGHLFDDGRWAANIGIGGRFFSSETSKRILGINAYYDYRRTHKQRYNQLALGFESLGTFVDFRLNGYLPIGKTKSYPYSARFSGFRGNHVIISQKKEYAFPGGNFEMGFHCKGSENVALYGALGPYCFARDGKWAVGGEGRILATIYRFLGLEFIASYDPVFKAIAQGQIVLNMPLGAKKTIKQRKGISCADEMLLRERLLQPVDRNEIIVVDTIRHHKSAINPVTGLPYQVWFVNNTSSSNGTFESPFNQLANAETRSSVNDIIYVYPGDGTDQGMNQGITLKDNQRLLGAGNAHFLPTASGNIVLTQMASAQPVISNSGGGTPLGDVIDLANNNVVSGLFVNETLGIFGIYGSITMNSASITNSTVVITDTGNPSVPFPAAILFGDRSNFFTPIANNQIGSVLIDNCQILGSNPTGATNGIFVNGGSNGSVEIAHTLFTGSSPITGLNQGINVLTAVDSTGKLSLNIHDNIFSYDTEESIAIDVTHNALASWLMADISNNLITVSSLGALSAGGIAGSFDNGGMLDLYITNNRFNFNNDSLSTSNTAILVAEGFYTTLPTGVCRATIANNTIQATGLTPLSAGIFLLALAKHPPQLNAYINNNTIFGSAATLADTGILIDLSASGFIQAYVEGNTITLNQLIDAASAGIRVETHASVYPESATSFVAATLLNNVVSVPAGSSGYLFDNDVSRPVDAIRLNMKGGNTGVMKIPRPVAIISD